MDALTLLFVVGLSCVVFAVLGAYVAKQKRRSKGEGAMLGLIFGPLGCLIEALLPTGDVMPRKDHMHLIRKIDEMLIPSSEEEESKAMEFLNEVDPRKPKPEGLPDWLKIG